MVKAFLILLAAELALAGVAKLRDPRPLREALTALGVPPALRAVRPLALAEIAGALAVALVLPPALGALCASAIFTFFALASALLWRGGWGQDCGCFGARSAGGPGRRLALNVLAALGAGCAAVVGGPLHGAAWAQAALFVLAAVLLGATAWPGVSGPARRRRAANGSAVPLGLGAAPRPSLEGLVNGSAHLLEQRFSRRSLLLRVALAGSAFCIAPLRYLLRPEPALAIVVPGTCARGNCTDGYTAFCCEINQGLNQCPAGTFAGGWWMCTDYSGHRLCREHGVRYYVDCNALPGQPFPGGCRCANGSCENRRINCNVFRYGQCNTHIGGVTPVVCRMVTCQNPSTIPALNCGYSLSVDDAVCGHEAGCLEPLAVQLAGAGGV